VAGTTAGIVLIAGMIVPTMVMAFLDEEVRRDRLRGAASVLPVVAIAVNYDFFARMLQFLSHEIRQRALPRKCRGLYTRSTRLVWTR